MILQRPKLGIIFADNGNGCRKAIPAFNSCDPFRHPDAKESLKGKEYANSRFPMDRC